MFCSLGDVQLERMCLTANVRISTTIVGAVQTLWCLQTNRNDQKHYQIDLVAEDRRRQVLLLMR